MSKPRNLSRRTSAGLFASVMAASAVTVAGGATTASAEPATPTTPVEVLGSHDAKLLAEAEAKKADTVTLIVSTEEDEAKEVAGDLTGLGATVTERYDSIGYVLATVPTGKVIEAATLPGVAAVDLDETIQLSDPRPVTNGQQAAKQGSTLSGPGDDTRADNPYMPSGEIGAVKFVDQNPEWDGRGITIGIMDSGVDLDHPALQHTTTGERKIVDWVTATHPFEDATWRPMITEVTGPAFESAGVTWTAPEGTYRFNTFREVITTGSELLGDVNRDGDTTDEWGVLYDPATNDILIDVDLDGDFTDETVMRPYQERFDIGHFGTDEPSTAVREQLPFVVEFREDVDTTPVGGPGLVDYVNIGIVSDAHGSHVAGITAANDMLGNEVFDGAAPGAKIVSSRACSWGGGCTFAALTTGMADLVINRGVDVINMSIGGLPALNDGNNARAELYNNLITTYGVQLVISGGNSGPGLNTVGDPSVAQNVVSVAASISKDTWLANYGSVVRTKNALFNFSSRGPREDGGIKPNVAAPGSAISTIPLWQAGSPVPEAGYSLPPGYGMFNGTSMASPQAAGAAALLLSAARATDRGVTPQMLRRALYSSAKPIKNVPTYGQGYGMVNVPNAWKLLRKGVQTRSYTSEAPVCTVLSDQLGTPNRGTGVHNRCAAGEGGHRIGKKKTYRVKITRTSGPTGTIKHNIALRGNDGTFRAPKSVALPLNRTVTVTVVAQPDAGAHGAIMTVDDPATNTIDFEVSLVVVAANDTRKPNFSFSAEGSVNRNGTTSYFVTVPPGTGALQVNLDGIATGSQTRFIAFNPYGVPTESTSSRVCFTNYSDPDTCKPQERDYQSPTPGVWEIQVESRRTSPSLNNPYQLTARIQGVAFEPAVVDLPAVDAGAATPVEWSLTNTFGPVTVTGQGGPLASVHTERPTIAEGAAEEFFVEVPADAAEFTARIGNPANAAADLDLYVFRGTSLLGSSADGDSEEAVTLTNPAPGTYRVVVEGYSVDGVGGSTAYDYLDSFSAAALGTLSAPSSPLALGSGDTGSLTGTVTAQGGPAAGRELQGELTLVTSEGAVVGRGAVAIGSVN